MTAVLDEEFTRISHQLGAAPKSASSPSCRAAMAYRKSTDTAEWSGGQFDGKIRVAGLDPRILDPGMLRSLAHETAHACLTMLGHWPAWLQEGIAQKLSGDSLSAAQFEKDRRHDPSGKLPRLSNLKQDWSRMDAEHAAEAYALSLAAVELFWQESGDERDAEICCASREAAAGDRRPRS